MVGQLWALTGTPAFQLGAVVLGIIGVARFGDEARSERRRRELERTGRHRKQEGVSAHGQ